MSNETPQLGQRIKAARIKLGLSQTELAAATKVSQEAISKYERGISKNPRSNIMFKLAVALGETPEFLQFGTGRKRKKYSAGNKQTDKEYRELLLSMSEFQEAVEAGASKEELTRILKEVVNCARAKIK